MLTLSFDDRRKLQAEIFEPVSYLFEFSLISRRQRHGECPRGNSGRFACGVDRVCDHQPGGEVAAENDVMGQGLTVNRA